MNGRRKITKLLFILNMVAYSSFQAESWYEMMTRSLWTTVAMGKNAFQDGQVLLNRLKKRTTDVKRVSREIENNINIFNEIRDNIDALYAKMCENGIRPSQKSYNYIKIRLKIELEGLEKCNNNADASVSSKIENIIKSLNEKNVSPSELHKIIDSFVVLRQTVYDEVYPRALEIIKANGIPDLLPDYSIENTQANDDYIKKVRENMPDDLKKCKNLNDIAVLLRTK